MLHQGRTMAASPKVEGRDAGEWATVAALKVERRVVGGQAMAVAPEAEGRAAGKQTTVVVPGAQRRGRVSEGHDARWLLA